MESSASGSDRRSHKIETDSVAAEVRRWLVREAGADQELPDDQPILDKGVLTSLTTLELVAFLEERFGVKVEDDEVSAENFATVRSIATLVANKRR